MKILTVIITLFFGVLGVAQDDENPVVLLVSESIQQAEILAGAAADDVLVIQYSARNTDLDKLYALVKDKLAGRLASSIGFATHDYGEAKFYLTGEHTISLGSTLDSQEQRKFWKDLGKLVAEEGRIDIFACSLAKTDQGKMLVSSLAELSGVDVAASVGETGNPEKGGDWILETADLDVGYVYFKPDRLQSFSGLLWAQRKKLLAADGATGDYFGYRVSNSGDYAIAGAYRDHDYGNYSGSAYIFARNQGGLDNWGQVQKLTAADGAANDYFGYRVSISGDYAIVGAHQDDDNGSNSGSAYIFARNQGGADNWGQVQKLIAADGAATDEFGMSVSISGDYAVVGAHQDDESGNDSGSAYIFARNQGGVDNWGQLQKLIAADGAAGDKFGISVSISGDNTIVGAHQDDLNGSAYIFARNHGGADNWGQLQKRIASDGADFDEFGICVSISGDYAVVGAHQDDESGNDSGSAYIFARNHGGVDNWGQLKKLLADDGAVLDRFGYSVSISGDYAIAGAWGDDDSGAYTGSAYIFARNHGGAGNWGQLKKLLADDAASYDNSGHSVSISGDYSIVGALGDDDNGANSGSAYIFEISCEVTVSTAINGTTDNDGSNSVFLGESITITATPQPGYYFTGWTGDASGSANPLTIGPVSSDMTITPVFALQTGTLIVNIAANGSGGSFDISGPPAFNGGNPVTGQTGDYNQTVPTGTYTVTFAPVAGYGTSLVSTAFVVSGSLTSGVLGFGSTETITGTYTQGQYSVYVNGANGGFTDRDGNNSVNHGDNLAITATTSPGYTFTGWTGDIISNDNPLNLTNITSDLNITPNFSQGTATLNVTISAGTSGGTYSISGPSNFNGGNPLTGQTGAFNSTVPVGTYVITYVNISGWGVAASATGMSVVGNIVTGELAVGANVSVSGSYTHGQYTVTVPTVTGGSTDHDGVNQVIHGGNLTITASANGDCNFIGWSGDVSTAANPLVLTNITRDYTVTPVFEGLPGKGNLKVTLLGTQNGRWRLAGEKVWRKSGVTLLDIPGGEHTIECKPVKGFHTPERELVLVNNKQTNYTVVEYIALLAKPKVHYFTATPDIVEPGGVVTLEWEVKGAENCKIVGINNHFLDKKGSELVRVSAKTNFELRASNEDGSSNATTSVDTASDLEILEFGCSHADGKPLYPGNVARLCWVAKGADKAILKNLNTGKTLIVDNIQGYLDVNPEETTEYSLSVTNTLIGEEKHLTLVVSDETYISSFSSNCENIFQGNKAKLSWEVQGIDAVEIIPGIGYVDPVGSVEVAISENSSFTLKAGNVEKSLSILAINEAPDLEVSLSEIKDQTGKKLKRSTIGQGVSVLAKVENRGSVSCSNLLIRLKNQNRIIDEVVVDSLASGESKTLTFNWIPRWNGRHKLELIADPENKVSEIQEGNNRAGKKIRVAGIGGIDLAIDDLKVEPGDDPAGRILKVSYSVYNLGTEESESFQYQVYLTKGSKQKLNKALALVADDHVDSLAPGEKVSVTRTIELSKKTKKLHLQGLIDVHNAIAEVNEENNNAVRKVK